MVLKNDYATLYIIKVSGNIEIWKWSNLLAKRRVLLWLRIINNQAQSSQLNSGACSMFEILHNLLSRTKILYLDLPEGRSFGNFFEIIIVNIMTKVE